MSYQKTWVPSPNFTPGNQTQSFYGRPRSVDMGAGHWWNYPRAGANHDGVVSMFQQSARQVAAHAVLSAGRVTEMVRPWDTAWCTSSANPYTYAIEVDPRIMFHWGQYSPSAGEKALGDQIFETLAEYIADMGYHNLTWKAHNQYVGGTECNPIPWGDVMARAKQIYAAKHAPQPAQNPEWKQNLKAYGPVTLYAIDDTTPLRNLANTPQVIKNFGAGTSFEIAAETKVGNYRYLLTRYAYENGTGQGFDEYELKPADPPKPEWQLNLKNIEPIKLMVIPAQTPIVNLKDGSIIKQLGQGTWVDIKGVTTVGGKEYYLSSYSFDNGMPNGMLKSDLAVPAPTPTPGPVQTPPSEKPKWLQNWEDIEDVQMYTRVDAHLVDLNSGNTIKTIPRGTLVEIASASCYLDKRYLITKYSTAKSLGQGILVDDLDFKDPNATPDPTPAPEQPPVKTVEERLGALEGLVATIKAMLDKVLDKLGIK